MRKPGYYWVWLPNDNQWNIAFYLSNGSWTVGEYIWDEIDFIEIGPAIVPPNYTPHYAWKSDT